MAIRISVGLNKKQLVGANDFILDNLTTNLVSAWSTRKLISTANSAFRLRRSSDDAESDFFFGTDGDVDQSVVATFLGGSNGFFTKIYDQVGSNHLRDTTLTLQPSYLVSSGKIVVDFDGVLNKMTSQNLLGISGDLDTSVFSIIQPDNVLSGSQAAYGWGDNTVRGNFGIDAGARGAGVVSVEYGTAPCIFQTCDTTLQKFTITKTAGTINTTTVLRRNGSAQSIQVGSDTGTPSVVDTTFFYGKFNTSFPYDGKVNECIVYDAVVSGATITSIESDQLTYWGV